VQSLSVLEACNGIASCKIFYQSFIFHHFTINYIWLILFLHELEQVLVLAKQFTSASSIETFLSSRYYSHVSSFSQLVLCKRRNLVKHLHLANKVVRLARCETQDLYNTDTSDMNESVLIFTFAEFC